MGKFNFEEYRQSWETGPHWELKKEFMERYCDMFPEERLLCLAQAYSNVVLMNCSYPDPVMHQISILSKPLEMRKKFLSGDLNISDENNQSVSSGKNQSVSGKRKVPEFFDKAFKKIKFCKSAVLSSDTLSFCQEDSPENQNKDNLLGRETLSLMKAKGKAAECSEISPSEDNGKIFDVPSKLVQDFVQKIRKSQVRGKLPLDSLMCAAQSMCISKIISFDIVRDQSAPLHTPSFCASFSINGNLVCSEKDGTKKRAKAKVAAAAIDTLINIITSTKNSNVTIRMPPTGGTDICNNSTISPLNHCIPQQTVFNKPSSTENSNINKIFVRKPSFILNKTLYHHSVLKGFVLVNYLEFAGHPNNNNQTLISRSAGFCRKAVTYNYDLVIDTGSYKATILLNNEVVGTAVGPSKKEAKTLATTNAVENLRKLYYVINVKNEYSDGYVITRSQVFDGVSFKSNVISESNIGCKMLKMMGWQGGGLGSSGITEPVQAQDHTFGRGLGFGYQDDTKLFKKRIDAVLQDYKKSESLSDLIFSKEFSKEERKQIHGVAGRYNLYTQSRGKDTDRFLSIRRKYTVNEVLESLVKAGGFCGKFELVDASNEPIKL